MFNPLSDPDMFFKSLDSRISDGWTLIKFDYVKRDILMKKDNTTIKAISNNGNLSWVVVNTNGNSNSPQNKSTKFYILWFGFRFYFFILLILFMIIS